MARCALCRACRRWGAMLAVLCSVAMAACDMPQRLRDGRHGIPRLTLSLQHLDPEANRVILLLQVRNVGTRLLTVPHVREGVLDTRPYWKNYFIDIFDQDRRLFDNGEGPREYIIMRDDLIELEPGEQYAVSFHIADAYWERPNSSAFGFPYPHLAGAPGTYRVSVRLDIYESDLDSSDHALRQAVWQGIVESNVLEFDIRRPECAYLPKPLTLPQGPADDWRCECRADCDPSVSANPCLDLPPDQQSQIARARGAELSIARNKAKEQARSQLVGISKQQVCFCTDPDGRPRYSYQ